MLYKLISLWVIPEISSSLLLVHDTFSINSNSGLVSPPFKILDHSSSATGAYAASVVTSVVSSVVTSVVSDDAISVAASVVTSVVVAGLSFLSL